MLWSAGRSRRRLGRSWRRFRLPFRQTVFRRETGRRRRQPPFDPSALGGRKTCPRNPPRRPRVAPGAASRRFNVKSGIVRGAGAFRYRSEGPRQHLAPGCPWPAADRTTPDGRMRADCGRRYAGTGPLPVGSPRRRMGFTAGPALRLRGSSVRLGQPRRRPVRAAGAGLLRRTTCEGYQAVRRFSRCSCHTSAPHYPGRHPIRSQTYRYTGTRSGAICRPQLKGSLARSRRQ